MGTDGHEITHRGHEMGTSTGADMANTGGTRKLPSGRWQARFVDPAGKRRNAPFTFVTKRDATTWLAKTAAAISAGTWIDPDAPKPPPALTLKAYADAWLPRRRVRGRALAPRTVTEYRAMLDNRILPELGAVPVPDLSCSQIETWYSSMDDVPTLQSRAYGLLRAILASAVDEDIISVNPGAIRGGGHTDTARRIEPATVTELEKIADAMPPAYRLLILLMGWCALRFGEATELRRSDIDTRKGIIRIRRAVVKVTEIPDHLPHGSALCSCRQGCIISTPKTAAGVRDVTIPRSLLPLVREHLLRYAAPDNEPGDGLLFPATNTGGHLTASSLTRRWNAARKAGNRPDLRLHDLRHTGLTLAAQAGATTRELMDRAGHTTPAVALRYQHAVDSRRSVLADRLDGMRTGSTSAN